MSNKYPFQNLPIRTKQGLYDPQFEHESCGVGLVANIDGVRSHSIITKGLEVLINLGHRGAAGADPETGDGSGILIQMPHKFLSKECSKLGINLPDLGEYGVGTVFLPQHPSDKNTCEETVNKIISEEGLTLLGWRDVPISISSIGSLSAKVMPVIKHFFVAKKSSNNDKLPLDLRLTITRKRIENDVRKSDVLDKSSFYICSLSSKSMVYKGLIMAHQLEKFYLDLADKSMITSFAMIHSRFSTNTLGEWKLAHPYRLVIHNGEINTLRGNSNWMTSRESVLSSPELGSETKKLTPVITPNQSDTASFDNTLELLLATGRSLPHSMMMMIPEAWADHIPMDQAKKDFYEYHSCLMEPWDGPTLMIGTDGTKVCAVLDRNGLRPCRYLVTKDNTLVMASETGVLDIPDDEILYKWRIKPGRMFLLDTNEGRIIEDKEIKSQISGQQPYGSWLKSNKISLDDLPDSTKVNQAIESTLLQRQQAFGYTQEELRIILEPMALTGKEPVGSMGNDSPIAILSDQNPLLFNYFKQLFAQVSNPPLDAIREELVTSVETFIGPEGNLFEESPYQCNLLQIKEPILTNLELEKIRSLNTGRLKTKTISTLFNPANHENTLEIAMDDLCKEVSKAIKNGYTIIILSDRGVDKNHAPIPSLLATSGVHHHMIREGTRTKVGIIIESGEPREVSHISLLFGFGAGAVNPYLAFETISAMSFEELSDQKPEYSILEKNFIKALHKGLVKVLSKMGISTLQSYRGAQIFEAVGLNQEFVKKYFTWTTSRIGGIGIKEIEKETRSRHEHAYSDINIINTSNNLKTGGSYQWRRDGEYHMWNPDTIGILQHSTSSKDPETFEEFTNIANDYSKKLCTIRGLLEFTNDTNSIPLDDVEPASEIVKRFATGAASLGSISKEAHETMAIAMNRIGARSNTGEGGEDHNRYTPEPNGDSKNSAIKQVASGRFGVTINYLSNATDLQIKMAQGSKPGEGGQLPGHKVDEYIGWVRKSTPGVELISPPPHHDIYSIEDLAQLIHDLKNSNPSARIHVKLVSEAGVGTIAAGVAKGHGDVVLISGDSGGTGASPESSIKSAGLPWELGVAETQQVLTMNDLRGRIVVQADGQLKTGRDVAIACLLGAEEFGFATAPLIVMGCIMLRKCHLNTCSVGIATQNPALRKQFTGQPEHLINYFFLVAEQLRTIMANLGFRNVNDMVGRVDKLNTRKVIDHWKAKGLDFSNILHIPDIPNGIATYNCQRQDHGLSNAIDHQLISKSQKSIESKTPVKIQMPISNSNRTVGTMLSHEIAKRYGEKGLEEDTIQVTLNGSAGQSFGAFLAKGISMHVEGDANDYFCKGLSGGKVSIKPPSDSQFKPEENVIIGNVALYGATAGKAYIRGIAGERFAVRNSGAEAVVEGVGDHGCEYMTGGKVVILGSTGRNFAAGMSGGIAYILDEYNKFNDLCNTEMVDLGKIESAEDMDTLKTIISNHLNYTDSNQAKKILESWQTMLPKFVKVMPRDYKRVLNAQKSS